jgi:Family of unknown function (DUF5988)
MVRPSLSGLEPWHCEAKEEPVPNASDSVTAELVNAVLLGGPISFPETERRQQVPAEENKIKIPHMGGYEHFHREDGELGTAEDLPLIFNWAMRTKIAE